MQVLQSSKTKEKLLNAPLDVQFAMNDFVTYMNASAELRTDIAERFNYQSLWAAIDRLMDFERQEAVALLKMKNAGYTADDAFMYEQYENEAVTV